MAPGTHAQALGESKALAGLLCRGPEVAAALGACRPLMDALAGSPRLVGLLSSCGELTEVMQNVVYPIVACQRCVQSW